jgi:hypothetical protein
MGTRIARTERKNKNPVKQMAAEFHSARIGCVDSSTDPRVVRVSRPGVNSPKVSGVPAIVSRPLQGVNPLEFVVVPSQGRDTTRWQEYEAHSRLDGTISCHGYGLQGQSFAAWFIRGLGPFLASKHPKSHEIH